MTTRRFTQVLAEVESLPADPARRFTQLLAEVESLPADPARRFTQLLVEVEYCPRPSGRSAQASLLWQLLVGVPLNG